MADQFKFFPALIASLALLFVLKVVGVWTGYSAALVATAHAQEEIAAAEEPAENTDVEEDAAVEDAPAEASAESAGDPPTMTATELEVLRSLSNRRAVLDQREKELQMREKLLLAAEQRVEERIDELKGIEARIEGLLKARDAAEEEQIQSLVKVYERMKPKDAARIFHSLERDILLAVSARMKEAAIAGILAQMPPDAAQDLTVRLATRLDLPETAAP